tara:strand:- start:1312 stop:1590 length:279 start_codon:yes stop_codon:yes gene_type:complete
MEQSYRDTGFPHGLITETVKGSNTITPAAGKAFYITAIVSSAATATRTLTFKNPNTLTLDIKAGAVVNPVHPIYATEISISETDLAVLYIEA